MASSFCSQSFAVLVVALYAGLLLWLAHVARVRAAPGLAAGILLAAWLTIPSGYAGPDGPPLDDVVVLALTAVGVLVALLAALSRGVGAILDETSGAWLVGAQGSRLLLALVLWRLAAEGLYPHRVAAGGMSLDLATGALAPLVAWLAFKDRALPDRWLLAFHGLGLFLLAVLLGEALLVVTSGSDVLEAAPFLWLPTFVVPVALFAHVASLRQVLRRRALPALA